MGEAKRGNITGTRLRRLREPSAPRALSKLVLPAGIALPSRDFANHAAAIAEEIRRRVRAQLVRGSAHGALAKLRDAIDAIGAASVAAFEDALRRAVADNAERGAEMAKIQCRRGCAFCCHVTVVVTPLEAIRLARRDASRGRAPAQAGDATVRFAPCPLLVDGACSVYDIRPFACRSLFSLDAARCEAGYGGAQEATVPSLDWPRLLSCGYITGQIAALDDLGLTSRLVELKPALALLTRDATALPRWLNGEDVFPHAA